MPKCECYSYCLKTGKVQPVEIMLNNRFVSIDACIVGIIAELNRCDVHPIASCCGHNRRPPSITMDADVSASECAKAAEILSEIDNRQWDVFQWRKIKTN